MTIYPPGRCLHRGTGSVPVRPIRPLAPVRLRPVTPEASNGNGLDPGVEAVAARPGVNTTPPTKVSGASHSRSQMIVASVAAKSARTTISLPG